MNYSQRKSKSTKIHVHINRISPNREREKTSLRQLPDKSLNSQSSYRSLNPRIRSKSPSMRYGTDSGSEKIRMNKSPRSVKPLIHSSEEVKDCDFDNAVAAEMTEEELLGFLRKNPKFCNKVKLLVNSKEKKLRPPLCPR